jgi:hypothetical protein
MRVDGHGQQAVRDHQRLLRAPVGRADLHHRRQVRPGGRLDRDPGRARPRVGVHGARPATRQLLPRLASACGHGGSVTCAKGAHSLRQIDRGLAGGGRRVPLAARLRAQTRRSYRLTLAALTAALEAADAEPTGEAIEAAARLRWEGVAPATWNRHAATVRSFLRYAARHRVLPELRVELDRRREPADRTRAYREPRLSGCGRAATSRWATRRCGGCCMRPRRGPARRFR